MAGVIADSYFFLFAVCFLVLIIILYAPYYNGIMKPSQSAITYGVPLFLNSIGVVFLLTVLESVSLAIFFILLLI